MPSVASLFICSLYPHPNLGRSSAFLSSCASSDFPHLLNPLKLASQSQYYTETTIATSPVTFTLLNLTAILRPHVPALSAEGIPVDNGSPTVLSECQNMDSYYPGACTHMHAFSTHTHAPPGFTYIWNSTILHFLC